MWLKLDMTLDDLADDGQIALLKADLELVLMHHGQWITRPDMPALPMTHTGIVHSWSWRQ